MGEVGLSYLEVGGIRVVASQVGQFAHGIDADDTLQGEVGLKGQPTSEVVSGHCDLVSIRPGHDRS